MSIGKVLTHAFRRIYIRPPEPIPPEHRRLLWLVGVGTLIANYDVTLYGMTLQITILILPAPLALIPIWFLPEPARKSLDEISAERAP